MGGERGALEDLGVSRVLVTGGTGLVGRQVVRALAALDVDVHACSRSRGDDAPGTTWHRVDLLDAEARTALLDRVSPTAVVHTAWHTDPADYRDSPCNIDWALASTELLRDAGRRGARRFVGVGTCFEYDLTAGWCQEHATAAAPTTLYGRVKAATGRLLGEAATVEGVSFAWGRIFYTFGPGEDPRRVVPYVVRQVLAGEVAACSPGEVLRDFLPAPQIGSALAALVRSDVEGSVNLCSGRPRLLADVLRTAAELAGDGDLLDLGARQPPPDEPPLVAGDARRLTHEVGWHPTASLEHDLAQTVDWWRDHAHG